MVEDTLGIIEHCFRGGMFTILHSRREACLCMEQIERVMLVLLVLCAQVEPVAEIADRAEGEHDEVSGRHAKVPGRRYCIRSPLEESAVLQGLSLWRTGKFEQFQLHFHVSGCFVGFLTLGDYRRVDSVDAGKME